MRAIFNVGKTKAQIIFYITPNKGPNTTRQCFTSHPCSKTAYSLFSSLYLRYLRPEVVQEFPIPLLYVRFLLKWHMVSISIPRVPTKTRNIYEPSIYSSIKLSPYNPLIIIIYINVQNTHALVYRLFPNIVSPYHVQGITPPEAIIVACLSSLIQARLMCYFLPWLVPAVLIKRDSPRFCVRPPLTALNWHVLLCLLEIFIS